jgi:NDP-sugar pyrophosphorylase family protein
MGNLDLKAVFLASGAGKRFLPFTANQPKQMVSLLGRPLLEHAVRTLHQAGVRDMRFSLCSHAQAVEAHFRKIALAGANLEFQKLDVLRGTAYSLKGLENYRGNVLVYYGDGVMGCDFPWTNYFEAHARSQADVTMIYKWSPDVRTCRVLTLDGNKIVGLREKPFAAAAQPIAGDFSAAVYLLSSRTVRRVCELLRNSPDPENNINDFMKNIFPRLLQESYRFAGFDLGSGYWMSVDRPEQYRQLFVDYYSGKLKLDVEPQVRELIGDPRWGYRPFLEPLAGLNY